MAKKTTGNTIRGMRTALGETQEQFGQRWGYTQGAVSGWESGNPDRWPSPEIYIRLAGLAFDPDDSIFFLEQAGIPLDSVMAAAAQLGKGGVSMEPILPVAERLLNEQLGGQMQRELEGKDFIVPPYKGTERLPFDVPVVATLVPYRASTFYIVAGAKDPFSRAGYGVDPGDIIVFDNHEPSYERSLGEKVVFEFEDGLFVGRLGWHGEPDARHLAVGPSDELPGAWSSPIGTSVRVLDSTYTHRAATHRQPHKIVRYLGVWRAQFGTGTQESWKRSARQHEPTEEQRHPRGRVQRIG